MYTFVIYVVLIKGAFTGILLVKDNAGSNLICGFLLKKVCLNVYSCLTSTLCLSVFHDTLRQSSNYSNAVTYYIGAENMQAFLVLKYSNWEKPNLSKVLNI